MRLIYVVAVAFLLGVFLMAGQEHEAYPGQHDHALPPAGWFCSPQGQGDHKCACKRVDADPLCDSTPVEDATCQVWCHADHCRCPIACQPQKK